MKNVLLFISIGLMSGCVAPKEMSAPCKRPANLTSFVEIDPRRDCPSMSLVNAEATAADALNSIVIGP